MSASRSPIVRRTVRESTPDWPARCAKPRLQGPSAIGRWAVPSIGTTGFTRVKWIISIPSFTSTTQ